MSSYLGHVPNPRTDLVRARSTLVAAELSEQPAERYLTAHRAAGQVAAVVLALRCRTSPGRGSLWQLLAEVAPELAEWAGFFAALQGRCEVLRAGAVRTVTTREADDLVRDASTFHDTVVRLLARQARGARSRGAAG